MANWKSVLSSLKQKKVAVMLGLGFSSGLPFMLVGNTLGFWLRESGITLTTIGFMSWVGLAYSFKFIWSPLVDKVKIPFIGSKLGLRRGWLLFSQALVMTSLIAMSIVTPGTEVVLFTAFAALAAFASATQDIVVDAWRIEASKDGEEMSLLSSAYQLGYRAALLLTDAIILIIAAKVGWSMSYLGLGLIMAIGMISTFAALEPTTTLQAKNKEISSFDLRKIFDAIVGPFIAFFKQHGAMALLMLVTISLYRLPDFFMGPMANPFYKDAGLSLETIGAIRGSVGLIASIIGIAAAGLSAVRLGLAKTLVIGAIVGPGSNLAFAAMAMWGATDTSFAVAMAIDNFSSSFAGTALVGYMSSLTSLGYVATQYALLSSFYALLGKVTKGFSGILVDTFTQSYGQMPAYALFFTVTALVGIPVVILCFILIAKNKDKARAAT